MNELIELAHQFLQNFCLGDRANQALLHKSIDLFLNPGVSLFINFCCIWIKFSCALDVGLNLTSLVILLQTLSFTTAAAWGKDHLCCVQRQFSSVWWSVWTCHSTFHSLHWDTRSPCPVPQVPPDHRQSRGNFPPPLPRYGHAGGTVITILQFSYDLNYK